MEPGKPRNAWLRLSDTAGLTEPGRKPQRQSPRLRLFLTVLWSLAAFVWAVQVVRDVFMGNPDYLKAVIASLFLILAIANYVMWRRSKRTPAIPSSGCNNQLGFHQRDRESLSLAKGRSVPLNMIPATERQVVLDQAVLVVLNQVDILTGRVTMRATTSLRTITPCSDG